MIDRRSPRTRLARLVLAVALLGAVFASTAGSALAQADSLERVRVKPAGISLSVPKAWVQIDPSSPDLAARVEKVSKKNPELGAVLEQASLSKVAKLIAIDPGEPGATFRENVNVLALDELAPAKLSQFEDELRKQFATVPGATVNSVKRVKLGAQKGFRADETFPVTNPNGETTNVQVSQVLLPRGAFRVTIVSVTSLAGSDTATGDKILASIRRLAR